MSTVAAPPSWLNAFDPANASTIASSLSSLTPPITLPPNTGDPANSATPAGFNVLNPASLKPQPAPGPSQFQQALDALKTQADTYLIQSALNGYQPLTVS